MKAEDGIPVDSLFQWIVEVSADGKLVDQGGDIVVGKGNMGMGAIYKIPQFQGANGRLYPRRFCLRGPKLRYGKLSPKFLASLDPKSESDSDSDSVSDSDSDSNSEDDAFEVVSNALDEIDDEEEQLLLENFDGMNFVVTGQTKELGRIEFQQTVKKFVEENGGQITTAVSGATNYLVAGSENYNPRSKEVTNIESGAKFKAAVANAKCKIISLETLKNMIISVEEED